MHNTCFFFSVIQEFETLTQKSIKKVTNIHNCKKNFMWTCWPTRANYGLCGLSECGYVNLLSWLIPPYFYGTTSLPNIPNSYCHPYKRCDSQTFRI